MDFFDERVLAVLNIGKPRNFSAKCVELVIMPFSRLRHVCRLEEGSYCKETKRDCAPQICPKIRK